MTCPVSMAQADPRANVIEPSKRTTIRSFKDQPQTDVMSMIASCSPLFESKSSFFCHSRADDGRVVYDRVKLRRCDESMSVSPASPPTRPRETTRPHAWRGRYLACCRSPKFSASPECRAGRGQPWQGGQTRLLVVGPQRGSQGVSQYK